MKMNFFFCLLILIQISVSFVNGQDNKKTIRNTYVAPEITKLIESTPIKDQKGTLSCWSFATTSFIETEAIRLGKEPIILSPIFYLLPTFIDKGEKYIRMQGYSYFGPGDLTFSVMRAYNKYGAIPQEVFSGIGNTDSNFDYTELNENLLKSVKHYVDSGQGKMTREVYRKDIEKILEEYIGKVPETFLYKEKEFTTKTFANEMIGINPDDYIEITSFNHHPFYSRFILETWPNWNNDYYLNLPVEDIMKIVDNALQNNYSLVWDGDISELGYNYGFAKLSDEYESMDVITQKMRQDAFDNYTTTDDHTMHIIGTAKDEKGNIFYVVKNSSSYMNLFGYTYMTKNYFLLKTISIMVHKDAIPNDIKEKCKID
jgi:bleomycin hydrolase